MKLFELKVRIEGTVWVEDPKCPSQWRGSGCYNVPVYTTQIVNMSIPADSEEGARGIALDWPYDGERDCALEEIEDVAILSCECAGECDDTEVEINFE